MNIFWLDLDVERSARYACDQHIVKMISEHAQMLITVLHKKGFTGLPMRATHSNHPCTLWVEEDFANFGYLTLLTTEYFKEYQRRYGKRDHLGYAKLKLAIDKVGFPAIRKAYGGSSVTAHGLRTDPARYITVPPQCVPQEFRRPIRVSNTRPIKNVIAAYRDCYRFDKVRFARWRYTKTPTFMKKEQV